MNLNWIKWLNPKNWIVGALKRTAGGIINAEADSLAARLKLDIAVKGPGAIDRTIDAAQARLIILIKTKGPMWAFLDPIRAQMVDAIQGFGDDLQKKLSAEVKVHGPEAVDLVMAQAKTILLSKLQAIAL